MTFVYIESLQLGLNTESSFRFEKELVEMTKLLGRQLPELRGGLVDGASRDLSWLVECTIRPPLTTPTAPTYTFRLIDCSWNDGAVRIIQQTIARLAYLCDYRFVGTRFELYGRRGEDGAPVPFPYPPNDLGYHLDDMEYLLHRTQFTLTTLRVEHENEVARNRALERQLRATRLAHTRLAKKKEALQAANTTLCDRLKTVREDLATRDSRIKELEEEHAELQKEYDDLLPNDDIPSDGMDMSEPSDQEDDDLAGDEEDPEEILFYGEDYMESCVA